MKTAQNQGALHSFVASDTAAFSIRGINVLSTPGEGVFTVNGAVWRKHGRVVEGIFRVSSL